VSDRGIREQGGGKRGILLNGITSSAGMRWRVTSDGAAISPDHAVDGVSTTSVVSALAPGCPLHSTKPALLPDKFLAWWRTVAGCRRCWETSRTPPKTSSWGRSRCNGLVKVLAGRRIYNRGSTWMGKVRRGRNESVSSTEWLYTR